MGCLLDYWFYQSLNQSLTLLLLSDSQKWTLAIISLFAERDEVFFYQLSLTLNSQQLLWEFWAQPQTTELKSSGLMQFISISSNFWQFIDSKMIQAYLSYDGYNLGQFIFVNVNRKYANTCVMSGHVLCSVTSSNVLYLVMLCHVS